MNYPTGDYLRESEVNRYYGDDTIYERERRTEKEKQRRSDRKLRQAVKEER